MDEANAADTLYIAAEKPAPVLHLGGNKSGLLRSDHPGQVGVHMRVKPLKDFRQLIRPYRAKLFANTIINAHEFQPFSKQ